MADGNNKKGRMPSQSSLYFRIVVSVYLFYLSYTIMGNLGSSGGRDYIIFLVASIAFIVAGLAIAIGAVKALKKGEYLNGTADSSKSDSTVLDENGKEIHQKKRIRFDENDDIDV